MVTFFLSVVIGVFASAEPMMTAPSIGAPSAPFTVRLSPKICEFVVLVTEFFEPTTTTFVDFFTSLPLPTIEAAPPPLAFLIEVRMASDKALGLAMPFFVLISDASKSLIESSTTFPAPTIIVPFAFLVRLAEPRMLSAIPAVLCSVLLRPSTLFSEPRTAAPKFCTP